MLANGPYINDYSCRDFRSYWYERCSPIHSNVASVMENTCWLRDIVFDIWPRTSIARNENSSRSGTDVDISEGLGSRLVLRKNENVVPWNRHHWLYEVNVACVAVFHMWYFPSSPAGRDNASSTLNLPPAMRVQYSVLHHLSRSNCSRLHSYCMSTWITACF